jgi:conjugative transfer signal peptidase TraF
MTALGAALLVPILASAVGSWLTWNLTPSVPRGLYVRLPFLAPTLGSTVELPVPLAARSVVSERQYLPGRADLVKTVVAVPGDEVCLQQGRFQVRGRVIASIRESDSRGRPLRPFWFCGPVPAGQAFVATAAPLSFDSRYFGPVSLSTLTVVKPLWTFSR